MKNILCFIGLVIFLSGTYTSCKESTLDTLRENEIIALDKYVKDNNLTNAKDASGIYFKLKERSADTTLIRSRFKVMIFFDITFLNGTAIPVSGFSTDDGYGHNYEEYPFYVDVNDATINEQYVQQIAGIHIGIKKMLIGGKAKMVIPSELAFKALDYSTSLGIPRFSTLLVTIEATRGYSPKQQEEENQ